MYKNDDWDLVDAKKEGKKVSAMPVDALPAEMRGMDEKEREAYVDQKAKERAELQAKITRLSAERDAYVATEMKKRAKDTTKSMDEALLESAKAQAAKADYAF
jgi:hypothetical protein